MLSSKRCRDYLEFVAVQEIDSSRRFVSIEQAIARLWLGQRPNEEGLWNELSTLYRKIDAGDFSTCLFARMLFLFGDSPLLSEEIKKAIKKELLRYDYWYDGDVRFPGNTIFWTENHTMLFRVSQYLIGLYYKDDIFKKGKSGLEMSEEVVKPILEWLNLKINTGFCEWDSSCYTEENLMSVLNLYDFAPNEEIKNTAERLLERMLISLALNTFDGYSCTTEGRAYSSNLMYPEKCGLNALRYLLWGEKNMLMSISGICMATTTYMGAEIADKIYFDDTVIEDYEQQGFYVEDGPLLGKGFETDSDLEIYWQNMGYTHRKILNQNLQMGEKYQIQINHQLYEAERFYSQDTDGTDYYGACYLGRVNKVLYKTADYALSTAQNYRKGEQGFQQHIWQATLKGGATIFTNNPGSLESGSGRPDLWAGNGEHPKAVQYKNICICIYRLSDNAPFRYSHAYIPRKLADETVQIGNWVFVRKCDGYAALYSRFTTEWGKEELHGSELICKNPDNVWICQMGSHSENGSFEEFIAQMLSCKIKFDNECLRIELSEGDVIETGWEQELYVNGQKICLKDYPRFQNKHYQCSYRLNNGI